MNQKSDKEKERYGNDLEKQMKSLFNQINQLIFLRPVLLCTTLQKKWAFLKYENVLLNLKTLIEISLKEYLLY